MYFFLEILGAAYMVSFVWFWSLCRAAAQRKDYPATHSEMKSNLIPFERGLERQIGKTRAV